jgi:hypothetical protein
MFLYLIRNEEKQWYKDICMVIDSADGSGPTAEKNKILDKCRVDVGCGEDDGGIVVVVLDELELKTSLR